MYHIPVHEIELDRNSTKPKKRKIGGTESLMYKVICKISLCGKFRILGCCGKKGSEL